MILDVSYDVPTPEPTGDFNAHGHVDAADYVVWRKGLGTTYTQDAYDLWRAHFGQTAASGATGSASANSDIPEPMSFTLAALAVSPCLAMAPVRPGQKYLLNLATDSATLDRANVRAVVQ